MSNPAPTASRTATAALSRHVGGVVSSLQRSYLSDRQALSGSAAAHLARLRRAVGAAPGADPFVWELLFDQWPSELAPRSDAATPAENAAHAALTLFAVHQQSKPSPMHQSGPSMGRAVSRLARPVGVDEEQRVRRRFNALATAATLTETLHHARGLVTQLRGADIPLDYGRLAADLFLLQSTAHQDQVRLRWGRDYYATDLNTRPADVSTTSAASDPGASNTEGDIQ